MLGHFLEKKKACLIMALAVAKPRLVPTAESPPWVAKESNSMCAKSKDTANHDNWQQGFHSDGSAKGNLRRNQTTKSTVPKVLLGLKAPAQSPNHAQGPFRTAFGYSRAAFPIHSYCWIRAGAQIVLVTDATIWLLLLGTYIQSGR